jgi:indole-3-glycerol phosphate synthase
MSDFLMRMARSSYERALTARALESERSLRRRALAAPSAPRVALSASRFDLIAEIKFRSPSVGALIAAGPDQDVAGRARAYEGAGAAVISVLTEPDHFGGHLHNLEDAARSVTIPIMRKDFLVDPYQIWEARVHGAAGVLLIIRMLDDVRLGEMLEAAGEAGMFVLLEAFDEADLSRIASRKITGASGAAVWTGVNTRDLTTLAVVPERLAEMAGHLQPGRISVAESGITTAGEAAGAAGLGYSLALVGTALMRAKEPGTLIREMLREGRAAREAPDEQVERTPEGR